MTITQAEHISDLVWKIKRIEGNIENLKRYIEYRESDDAKTNKRPDDVRVYINTYQRGCFDFSIDELMTVRDAREMLDKAEFELREAKLKLDLIKILSL
jgi:hypothetical protein